MSCRITCAICWIQHLHSMHFMQFSALSFVLPIHESKPETNFSYSENSEPSLTNIELRLSGHLSQFVQSRPVSNCSSSHSQKRHSFLHLSVISPVNYSHYNASLFGGFSHILGAKNPNSLRLVNSYCCILYRYNFWQSCNWLVNIQVAQLSQRDRAAGWVSYGQKWKTGTGRQCLRTI